MSFFDHLKAAVWARLVPAFPKMRDALLKLRVLKHDIRQPYVLGRLAPGRTVEGLAVHLAPHGFANHFVAWVDAGEVLGLRKLVDFHRQYHLRVFQDGEIRGHYEWTPESRPFDHFFEFGMEPRYREFLGFLGDWLLADNLIK